MAEEEKKKIPMALIAGLVVIGLILAGGISYFIASKVMTESVGKVPQRDPGVFVKLGDAKDGIIVNVGGVKGGRFLKVNIVLEVNPGDSQNMKEGKILSATETRILDSVLQILRSQSLDSLEPSKQVELKETIKDELSKVVGKNFVYDVYITSFVLQ